MIVIEQGPAPPPSCVVVDLGSSSQPVPPGLASQPVRVTPSGPSSASASQPIAAVVAEHPAVAVAASSPVWTDDHAASWMESKGWRRTVKSKYPFIGISSRRSFSLCEMLKKLKKTGSSMPPGFLQWCHAKCIC